MAEFVGVQTKDAEGNITNGWASKEARHDLSVPGDVWNELFRRAKKGGWDEAKIEPYEWNGKLLIIQQKEPNAGKIKVMTQEEADPKLKGQEKVVVELLERVKFLERRLQDAETPKPEAKVVKEKAKVDKALPEMKAEVEAFVKLHWKKAKGGLEAGDFDAILNDLVKEPVSGVLSKVVKEAVDSRLKVVMNG
jgi:hypothetical protein